MFTETGSEHLSCNTQKDKDVRLHRRTAGERYLLSTDTLQCFYGIIVNPNEKSRCVSWYVAMRSPFDVNGAFYS